MVDRGNDRILPVTAQAELLSVPRSSLYYHPAPPSAWDLEVKRQIDKIYTAHPEFGYRRICAWLARYHGIHVNHKAVLRHMREMGIQAIYPRQDTSQPNPANPVYPYLLKGVSITVPSITSEGRVYSIFSSSVRSSAMIVSELFIDVPVSDMEYISIIPICPQ